MTEREQMYTPEQEIRDLETRLFPINRSLTGEGVRASMKILQEVTDFQTFEIPSGTNVCGWTVPKEWNVTDAFIDTDTGRVIDFKNNNLHLVGYSTPIDAVLSYDELEPHLHTITQKPQLIPYVTSYYKPDWGFCLTENQKKTLNKEAKYHVKINSFFDENGSMTVGESYIRGNSDEEFVISTYSCHPSMANDNLSGMIAWALLQKELKKTRPHYSYRFIIGPETIGTLAFLASHDTRKIRGAFVLTNNGGFDEFSYKKTFKGNSEIDRALLLTLKESGIRFSGRDFDIRGSDERQFSAPGFQIPTVSIFKGKYYEYYDYHTSGDNRLNPTAIIDTVRLYKQTIDKLETNRTYTSNYPYGEPFLERFGLYSREMGRPQEKNPESLRDFRVTEPNYGSNTDAILWLMFYGDGNHSLMDISEATGFPMKQLYEQAQVLIEKGILK